LRITTLIERHLPRRALTREIDGAVLTAEP
jgi:hypothetical protein